MKLQQGMYECNFYKLNLNKIKKDKNASITRQWKKYVGFISILVSTSMVKEMEIERRN